MLPTIRLYPQSAFTHNPGPMDIIAKTPLAQTNTIYYLGSSHTKLFYLPSILIEYIWGTTMVNSMNSGPFTILD